MAAGVLTIDYTATGATAESVTIDAGFSSITLSGDISGSINNPNASVSKIVVQDSGGSNAQSVTFTGSSFFVLSNGLSVNNVETVSVKRSISVTGAGSLSIIAPRNISVTASLSSVNGDLVLKANRQVTPASGNYFGVSITSVNVSVTGTGNLTIEGRGGDTGDGVLGVYLNGASVSGGLSGSNLSILGIGGPSAGSVAEGVLLISATVNSLGGNVSVVGQGGGNSSSDEPGVDLLGTITAGGTGSVSVSGTGGPGSGGGYGVRVNGVLTSNGGNVKVTGNATGLGHGVFVSSNGQISAAGLGTIEVTGVGGVSNAINRVGVYVSGAMAKIQSTNGDVTVNGTGGGNGISRLYYGILTDSSATINAGGSGNLTLIGKGGTGFSRDHGVVSESGTWSAGGNISITGIEGPSTDATCGLFLQNGKVTSGGTITVVANNVDIDATSSLTAPGMFSIRQRTANFPIVVGSGDWYGTRLGLDDAELDRITAASISIGDANTGDMEVFGVVTSNNHLSLTTGTKFKATNAITMAANKHLVVSSVSTLQISSNLAQISASGSGSISLQSNRDITIGSLTSLTTVDRALLLSANQQASPTAGNFVGIDVNGGTVTVNGTGALTMQGRGGDTNAANHGIQIRGSSTVTGGTTNSATLQGTGGPSISSINYGVYVFGSKVTSKGDPVVINGTGGGVGGSVTGNFGVHTTASGTITTGGAGNLTINAVGGTSTSGGNVGARLAVGSTWSAGGSVSITATEGTGANSFAIEVAGSTVSCGVGGSIAIIADTNSIDATANITSAGTVTLRQRTNGRAINLGGTDSIGTNLGLADAELDRVTAGTLQIGDGNAGPLTVSSAITRTAKTAIGLTTGGTIGLNQTLDSLGGNISMTFGGALTQTAGTVQAGTGTLTLTGSQTATFNSTGNKAGTLAISSGVTCLVNGSFDTTGLVQVAGTLGGTNGTVGATTVTSTGKLAPGSSPGKLNTGSIVFNASSELSIELNGTSVGTQYDQLAVTGTVNLGNAKLSGTVGFTPANGQVFTIIANDGSDSITNTFNGYADGAKITLSGFNFTISYKGGDGNDVTLTRVVPPPTVTNVTFGDGTNQRSMVKQIVVTFSEAVSFSPDVVSAFTLSRTGSDTPTGNVAVTANPPSGSATSVTITFSGGMSENGSLRDGFYDFTISAGVVSGAGGALDGNNDGIAGGSYTVTGTTANKYFRLFGDADGSGQVDFLNDFIAFRSAFASGGPSTIFDYDNSGGVDFLVDFINFRNRFNATP